MNTKYFLFFPTVKRVVFQPFCTNNTLWHNPPDTTIHCKKKTYTLLYRNNISYNHSEHSIQCIKKEQHEQHLKKRKVVKREHKIKSLIKSQHKTTPNC